MELGLTVGERTSLLRASTYDKQDVLAAELYQKSMGAPEKTLFSIDFLSEYHGLSLLKSF